MCRSISHGRRTRRRIQRQRRQRNQQASRASRTRAARPAAGPAVRRPERLGSRQPAAKATASGQPIGGNDSNTGSGTTLSQGADFGGQSSSGQTAGRPRAAKRCTTDRQSGSRARPARAKSSSGEGFIGSQGSGSDEYLREGGGSDFARQGRGALDEDENESDSGPERRLGKLRNRRRLLLGELRAQQMALRPRAGARRLSYAANFARIAVSRSIHGAKLGRARIRST